MAKTANINLRIEPERKEAAEKLFNSFGLSVTDAIDIFINTSLMEGGFPFQIQQLHYNRDTELALKEARDIIAGKRESKSYSSFAEALEDSEV